MRLEDRERLGRAWLEQGLGEHASVAAFARFVLHLIALGAPPELLRESIRAMDDEVTHACICFDIARRFRGSPAGPGPLNLSRILEQPYDPTSILESAIIEGCIDETVAARGARAATSLTEDPAIRKALERIAEEESRHADLSWKFVGWMLETYPAMLPTARHCFALAVPESLEAENPNEDQDLKWMEQYGQLLENTKEQVRIQAWRDEIQPRISALLGRDFLGSMNSTQGMIGSVSS